LAFSLAAFLLGLALPRSADRIDVHFAPSGEKRVLEDRLAAEIRAATEDIRVAMFHFTSERLVQALVDRRKAGVPVSILLDSAQADDAFVDRLRRGGLDVRRVTPREEGARFHHKFCVLDGKIVATGSYNWTVLGDQANHENVVLVRHEGAARAFRSEFDRIWQDPALSRP